MNYANKFSFSITRDPRQVATRGEIDPHYFPPMQTTPCRTGRT